MQAVIPLEGVWGWDTPLLLGPLKLGRQREQITFPVVLLCKKQNAAGWKAAPAGPG